MSPPKPGQCLGETNCSYCGARLFVFRDAFGLYYRDRYNRSQCGSGRFHDAPT